MSDLAIATAGLTKHYGGVTAVDSLNLEVREGDRFGFLGPNGSGKTTTVRMLLGLVFASSGSIELLGAPVPRRLHDVLPRVGALIEGPAFWPAMSGRAALARYDAAGPAGSRRTRHRRIETALERVGLAGIDRRPVKAYSLGMRQRLGLAAALLRAPRLLVLDEPTNGLDPQGMREIRELLAELNREGTTIFLSSHLLGEVESLCNRVAIVNGGRLVVAEDVELLRAPTGRVVVRTPDLCAARQLLGPAAEPVDGDRLVVPAADPAALAESLVRAGVRVAELVVERRTLEDVFVELTAAGSDRWG